MSPSPNILLIDDDDGQMRALKRELERENRVNVTVLLPDEITLEAVSAANLVIVDQELELDNEPHSFPNWIPDGVALAASLRRHIARRTTHNAPVGFALITSQLEKLAAPLPVPYQKTQLARQTNLEWIFNKNELGRFTQIASLAEAISRIPANWEDGIQGLAEVAPILGIDPAAPDATELWESIERCHPPTFEITRWTHGLAFIRWLATSILSYPCFLWDERRLAARFRVSPSDFRSQLKETPHLKSLFDSALYTGVLSDFLGARWWGHRIEQIIWTLTEGTPQDASKLRDIISSAAGRALAPTSSALPILCHNEQFEPIDDTYSFEHAVRIQPDGWPPYAEPAWIPKHIIELNPYLRSLIIPADIDRI